MEPVAHSDSASHELLSQPGNQQLDVPQDPDQAFLYAVRRNDVAEVRQYLHRDPGLINRARVKGDRWPDDPPAKDDTQPNADLDSTALILAAYYGHARMCRVLLRNGADPLITCSVRGIGHGSWGAVYWAAAEGNLEAFVVVLDWIFQRRLHLLNESMQQELLRAEKRAAKIDTFVDGDRDTEMEERKKRIEERLREVCDVIRETQKQHLLDILKVSVYVLVIPSITDLLLH